MWISQNRLKLFYHVYRNNPILFMFTWLWSKLLTIEEHIRHIFDHNVGGLNKITISYIMLGMYCMLLNIM